MFEFLEVNENEHKEQALYHEVIKEIPDNQRLYLSDLRIIKPEIKALKIISKRILDKYSIIPLFIVLPNNKPLLPKHLSKEYWGSMHGKKDFVLYVAMPNPFDNQILNIIRNITDYSVISIPINKSDSEKFLINEFEKTVNPEKSIENKEKKQSDLSIILKDNISYIILFGLIIAGLISIKILIGK